MRSFVSRLEHRSTPGFHSDMTRGAFRWSMRTILFLVPFSIVVLGWGLFAGDLSWMAPISICLAGVATVLSESRVNGARYAVVSLARLTSLVLVVEWIGVTTGFPFGAYRYTDVLGPSIVGVPLVIPFAWYTTVINAFRMAEYLAGGSRMVAAFGAATISLGVDILLEPTAVYVQRYWQWDGPSVPIENYVTWFLLSMALGLSIRQSHVLPEDARVAVAATGAVLVLQQVLLFAVTDTLHGYPGAAMTGLLLIGAFTIASGRYRFSERAGRNEI